MLFRPFFAFLPFFGFRRGIVNILLLILFNFLLWLLLVGKNIIEIVLVLLKEFTRIHVKYMFGDEAHKSFLIEL